MNFADYSPTFRNVLLREVKVFRTRGGVILPSTEYLNEENNKVFVVLKTGKDCTEVKPGYLVKTGKQIYLETFKLYKVPDEAMKWQENEEITSSEEVPVLQVMEQQIIGYVKQ